MPNIKKFEDYRNLLARVRQVLIEGQRRIEIERVRTYWETGDHIHSHVLHYKDHADYGKEVLVRLANDLDVHVSLLRRCLQFRENYPRLPIHAARREFTWTHYRELITIPDRKIRDQLEEKAARSKWSTDELSAQIKSSRKFFHASKTGEVSEASIKSPAKPLTPIRGTLYTYRLVKRPQLGPDKDSGLLVDCGFGNFRDIDPRVAAGFSEGDIVESRPREDAYKFYKGARTVKDLFTYAAFVEKVIDGDTLKVRFDLGFDQWFRDTLRLRDIDCPEVDTKEGQEAKAFVQSYIKEAQLVVVRSSRSDKYARYLADVFIPQGEDPDPETDIYLNNLLLEKGLASRVG